MYSHFKKSMKSNLSAILKTEILSTPKKMFKMIMIIIIRNQRLKVMSRQIKIHPIAKNLLQKQMTRQNNQRMKKVVLKLKKIVMT